MQREVTSEYFAAHSLELLEESANKQEEVVILKDGKPIGKLVPMETRLGGRVLGDIVEPVAESDERPRKTLEEMRAEGGMIHGDIVEPIDW